MVSVRDAANVAIVVATHNPLPAIPAVAGTIVDIFQYERNLRIDRWWKRVWSDPAWEDPLEVQGKIEEKVRTDPKARDTIWQAAKHVVETTTPEAIEVIGSLTAEFLREEKEANPYFRGAVRLLADLSSVELTVLREIVRACNTIPDPNLCLEIGGNTLQFKTGINAPAGPSIILSGDAKRVFRLLKANDLGSEPGSGGAGQLGGPSFLIPNKEDFKNLARHLGVSSSR